MLLTLKSRFDRASDLYGMDYKDANIHHLGIVAELTIKFEFQLPSFLYDVGVEKIKTQQFFFVLQNFRSFIFYNKNLYKNLLSFLFVGELLQLVSNIR